ncbi:Variant SH3 domain [Geosmithia morbida]|uniref:Variant SH3 domain n=1 Tax=Geosmithia morbida TaxID=1094350 RepID=A0A9P4Z0T3_9HYPO|nr:Variant SH3 domain [Geosmithia morbida]KAF4125188.1 Variant SH3 domain [Geosmithia morbida]
MATDTPPVTSAEESTAPSAAPGANSSSSSSSNNNNTPAISSHATSPPSRPNTLSRPMSFASKSRLSQYSTASAPSRSRPPSHAFPMFPSSLSYALVRDFAYPAAHPLHYGPPPEPSAPPSGWTTPMSEHRRLSDPPGSWDQRMPWDSWTADGFGRGQDVPPISFGDGPPYSEDEDLQSPVVATRHRKHKSTSAAMGGPARDGSGTKGPHYEGERGYYVGSGGNGSERYYVGHGGEANGPGGEVVTYHRGDAGHSQAYYCGHPPELGREVYVPSDRMSQPSSPDGGDDESRYSRDYQFTITSPDEEFHGKAVALFDFARENENELPLVEGQIIWVSYRHGQGWLVAEDPKTQENGLVPEEYVRLLRDIEGGMNSLAGQLAAEESGSPNDVDTPTVPESGATYGPGAAAANGANGYHQPVVSMFSTSSKDLDPYPKGQLGLPGGQVPPQVVHYHGQRGGSQANTPTQSQPANSLGRRESQDAGDRDPAPEKKAAAAASEE